MSAPPADPRMPPSSLPEGVDAVAVRGELDRVLASAEFASAQRLSEFLRVVVEETLAGNTDTLSEYALARRVHQRDVDFNPQTSAVVRVDACRLRRRLKVHYAERNASGIRIDLPSGTYVPTFESLPRQAGTRAPADDPAIEIPAGASVAVLPFDNISTDEANEVLADGITEEIITLLSQNPDLFVIARNSTFVYKGKPIDIREVGTSLGVRFVLEGSVRRAGDQLRVTAQLLDARSGGHVWAETYDRELTPKNVLDVEHEIASTVAARVGQPYGAIYRRDLQRAIGRADAQDMTGYDAVLRFYRYYASPGLDAHVEASRFVEAAWDAGAGSPTLWAARAILLTDDWRFSFGVLEHAEQRLDEAEALAKRAIDADPRCALGYQALQAIYLGQRKYDAIRQWGEAGLSVLPNHAEFLCDYGFYLAFAGDWERGLELLAKGCTLNPHHPGLYLAPFLFDAYRREDYATAAALAAQLRMPDLFWEHALKAIMYWRVDRLAEAKEARDTLHAQYPTFGENVEAEMRKWLRQDDLIARVVADARAAGL